MPDLRSTILNIVNTVDHNGTMCLTVGLWTVHLNTPLKVTSGCAEPYLGQTGRPSQSHVQRGPSPVGSKPPTSTTHEWTGIIVNKSSDPQTDKASGNPEAAICVQNFSARRVLQFTPFIAASCVLHRSVNRVIHRLKLFYV